MHTSKGCYEELWGLSLLEAYKASSRRFESKPYNYIYIHNIRYGRRNYSYNMSRPLGIYRYGNNQAQEKSKNDPRIAGIDLSFLYSLQHYKIAHKHIFIEVAWYSDFWR